MAKKNLLGSIVEKKVQAWCFFYPELYEHESWHMNVVLGKICQLKKK